MGRKPVRFEPVSSYAPRRRARVLAAFRAANLHVRHCIEPPLGAAEVEVKRRAFRHVPDAALAAYVGLPAALVWDAEKA